MIRSQLLSTISKTIMIGLCGFSGAVYAEQTATSQPTIATAAPSIQPSIEFNSDVIKTLASGVSSPSSSSEASVPAESTTVKTTTSSDGSLAPSSPASVPEGSRVTTITTVTPRLVWIKGPEGKIVELKPDAKPKRKKRAKPAAPQCPCPAGTETTKTEPSKAEPAKTEPAKDSKKDSKSAPVTPVTVEENKPQPATPAAVVPAPESAPATSNQQPATSATPTAQQQPVVPAVAVTAEAPKPATPTPVVAPTPTPTPATNNQQPATPAAAATPPAPPPATPAPAAAPTPATSNQQPATTTTAAAPQGTPDLSLVFKSTETTLPLTAKEPMDSLVARLKADEALRVNLVAYAASPADQTITARRVSLARALAIRAYLIDNGINNTRVNMLAEGDKNPGGEADRVDIFVAK